MIKWRFIFGDKHVEAEVKQEIEDEMIAEAMEEKFLFIAGEERDLYVNLAHCTVAVREPISQVIPTITPEV